MNQKTYFIRCLFCGCIFETLSENRKYCPECTEKYGARKTVKRHKKSGKERQDINAILMALEEYNKEHGTLLSYGQYVALTERNKRNGRTKKHHKVSQNDFRSGRKGPKQ